MFSLEYFFEAEGRLGLDSLELSDEFLVFFFQVLALSKSKGLTIAVKADLLFNIRMLDLNGFDVFLVEDNRLLETINLVDQS